MTAKRHYDTAFIRRLYLTMPGAPMPTTAPEPYEYAWGEVEGNEHWQFCSEIVTQIINAAQAYSR